MLATEVPETDVNIPHMCLLTFLRGDADCLTCGVVMGAGFFTMERWLGVRADSPWLLSTSKTGLSGQLGKM